MLALAPSLFLPGEFDPVAELRHLYIEPPWGHDTKTASRRERVATPHSGPLLVLRMTHLRGSPVALQE
jgi:hypothetical protein